MALHSLVLRAAALTVVLTSVTMAAELVKPDIKPGLWEVTIKPEITGQLPIPPERLAAMTPEQRARIETAMQAHQGSAAKSSVYKDCLTPEKIARGFDIDKKFADDASCKRTIVTSTRTELRLHDECVKSERKTTSDVHVQVTSGSTMVGTVKIAVSSGDRTMNVNNAMQGKWLSSSCGAVKDSELEK